jgi:hypothetical protein
MKLLMPTRKELFFFAILAIVCAAIVGLTSAREVGMAFAAMPIFTLCAFMGTRRSGQWASLAPRPARVELVIEEEQTA